MVILLEFNEISFQKSENLEKTIHISQSLAKILTENCRFLKKFFSMVFLKLPCWRYY